MEKERTPKEEAQASFDTYKNTDLWLHQSCLEDAIELGCDEKTIQRKREVLNEYIKLCDEMEG